MVAVGRVIAPAAEDHSAPAEPSQQWAHRQVAGTRFRHKFTVSEYLESYSLGGAEVADVIRAALRLLRKSGWTPMRGSMLRRVIPDCLSMSEAIAKAASEVAPTRFNIHQASLLVVEAVAQMEAELYGAALGRSFQDVSDLFCRAIWRAQSLDRELAK